jgi:hypothetical protein
MPIAVVPQLALNNLVRSLSTRILIHYTFFSEQCDIIFPWRGKRQAGKAACFSKLAFSEKELLLKHGKN